VGVNECVLVENHNNFYCRRFIVVFLSVRRPVKNRGYIEINQIFFLIKFELSEANTVILAMGR